MNDEKVSFNSNGEYTFVSGVKKMSGLTDGIPTNNSAPAPSKGLDLSALRKRREKPAAPKPKTETVVEEGNQTAVEEITLDTESLLCAAERKDTPEPEPKKGNEDTLVQHMRLDTPINTAPVAQEAKEVSEPATPETLKAANVKEPEPDLGLNLKSISVESKHTEDTVAKDHKDSPVSEDLSLRNLSNVTDDTSKDSEVSDSKEEVKVPVDSTKVEQKEDISGGDAVTSSAPEKKAEASTENRTEAKPLDLAKLNSNANRDKPISTPPLVDESKETTKEQSKEENSSAPVTKFSVVAADEILAKPYGKQSLKDTPNALVKWVDKLGREFARHPAYSFESSKYPGIKAYVMFFMPNRKGGDRLCIGIGKGESFTAVTFDSSKNCLVDVSNKLSVTDGYINFNNRVLVTASASRRKTIVL